jgi:hypothetical protein
MNRIYHPFWLWEDYKCGFYDNVTGEKKTQYIDGIIRMFNSESETRKNMLRVINEWVYSCQHNLTNLSLNRIAYIGQGATCLYCGAPSTITMEAWSLLTKEVQMRSDKIALEVIEEWETKNKNIQLCLKLD